MWMVSADGEMPYSMWKCQECGAFDQHGPGYGPGRRGHVDEGASEHVQAYGHVVTVQHGQCKELRPLATEPPPGARRHPDDGARLTNSEREAFADLTRRMR